MVNEVAHTKTLLIVRIIFTKSDVIQEDQNYDICDSWLLFRVLLGSRKKRWNVELREIIEIRTLHQFENVTFGLPGSAWQQSQKRVHTYNTYSRILHELWQNSYIIIESYHMFHWDPGSDHYTLLLHFALIMVLINPFLLKGLCSPCASPSTNPWTLLRRVRRQLGRGRGPLASGVPQIHRLKR